MTEATPPAASSRITVFCQDVPYPPNHGGKVDLWNLIRGLHRHGVTIQLVCWFKRERIGADVRAMLANEAVDIVEVPRRDGWWRLFYAKYPPRMLSFTPSTRAYAELESSIRTFSPDWLLLDHWMGYLTARKVATALGCPLVYRSQNVEHRYFRDLRRFARGVMKIKLSLNAVRLFATEREIRSSVDLVADISAEDTEEWRLLGGAGNAIVVPPICLESAPPGSTGSKRDIDMLFVGNLRTPNNLEGLRWFAEEVLPTMRRAAAPRQLRVVFAGSEPDANALDRWRRADIECVPDPADVSEFFPRARVVINPLQQGSGVNLKMIEALASGRPIVATAMAVRGLPEKVRSHVVVGSTPEAFATAALKILGSEECRVDPVERAALLEECFGVARLQSFISALDAIRPGTPTP